MMQRHYHLNCHKDNDDDDNDAVDDDRDQDCVFLAAIAADL